jgi:hypothetical protein
VVSPTEITATTAGATNAGRFNLFVLEGGASSTPNSGDEYTYAPAVSQVSPASGTLAGGTPITITGTGFVSGAVVEIAQGQGAGPTAVPATGVNVVSPTEITATTAGATKAGTFNLFVLEDGESSSANSGDYYTYTATHVSVASRTPRGAPNKPRLRAPRVRRPPPARETHGRHSVTPVGPVSSPSGRLALGAR